MTELRDRGIIFGAPMIRRIRAGQKTQTRRPVVLPKRYKWRDLAEWESLTLGGPGVVLPNGTPAPTSTTITCTRTALGEAGIVIGCPYTDGGDRGRLWVRETFAAVPWASGAERRVPGTDIGIRYRATWDKVHSGRWTSPLFLQRVAARITLEITQVRVQRLHDITNEDAIAEGAQRFDDIQDPSPYKHGPRWSMESPASTDDCLGTARFAFANMWNKIHGDAHDGPEPWNLNPWVWALSFKRVEVP